MNTFVRHKRQMRNNNNNIIKQQKKRNYDNMNFVWFHFASYTNQNLIKKSTKATSPTNSSQLHGGLQQCIITALAAATAGKWQCDATNYAWSSLIVQVQLATRDYLAAYSIHLAANSLTPACKPPIASSRSRYINDLHAFKNHFSSFLPHDANASTVLKVPDLSVFVCPSDVCIRTKRMNPLPIFRYHIKHQAFYFSITNSCWWRTLSSA